jgi:hypothetical protein
MTPECVLGVREFILRAERGWFGGARGKATQASFCQAQLGRYRFVVLFCGQCWLVPAAHLSDGQQLVFLYGVSAAAFSRQPVSPRRGSGQATLREFSIYLNCFVLVALWFMSR